MKLSRYYVLALFLSSPACKAEAPSKITLAAKATAHTAACLGTALLTRYAYNFLKAEEFSPVSAKGIKNPLLTAVRINSVLSPLYVSYRNGKAAYSLVKRIFKTDTINSQATETSASPTN